VPLQRKPRKDAPRPLAITEESVERQRVEEHPLVIVPAEDAKILQGYAAGDLIEDAVRDVFPDMTRKNAITYGEQVLRTYNGPLIQALERRGINIDKVAAKIGEQLEAKTPLQYRGELTGAVVEDGAAQRWAVDTVLDILPGARAPKQTEIKKTSLEAIILKIQQEGGDDDD
jgi:hypothetical protein